MFLEIRIRLRNGRQLAGAFGAASGAISAINGKDHEPEISTSVLISRAGQMNLIDVL